ncbi:uncharacterized protein STEHIDRAFT_145663 [Stereum hirsutum FP-91666 SS1]|uniref:uncharacterized protein n=1 Tax=Stereum hirsutum (strain FP-91666) TaxID=721885 RepID=UPI000440AF0C|nr:uncharacterized protein STEHIDRAFT_145663 [Stereum hirsutum FP-91666 SS1]EIM88808.1 hypothetical protein STEHIDRAFT_145663 [Stereum hirsutum FP-91666 SS1]
MAPFKGSRKTVTRSTDDIWVHDLAEDAKTSRPTPTAPAAAVAANTRLAVSNVHYEITEKDLTAIFGQIGTLVREPLIKYDRSGRSTGVAIIAFETASEAAKAKEQFQGVLAKGQPISIEYDTQGPPIRRMRSATVPTGTPSGPKSSLMARMGLAGAGGREKAPLIARLGTAEKKARDSAVVAARGGRAPQAAARGGRRGRGAPGGVTAVAGRGPRESKKPKTAQELDSELDAFMGPAPAAAAGNPPAIASRLGVVAGGQPAAIVNEDVEMS